MKIKLKDGCMYRYTVVWEADDGVAKTDLISVETSEGAAEASNQAKQRALVYSATAIVRPVDKKKVIRVYEITPDAIRNNATAVYDVATAKENTMEESEG